MTTVTFAKSSVTPLSYATRAELVAANNDGVFAGLADGQIVRAGNVWYERSAASTQILDLSGFIPHGVAEFEHYGGREATPDVPTRASISHDRSGSYILDVIRIYNPRPGTIKMLTHPTIASNGDSEKYTPREFSAADDYPVTVNLTAFKNADGSSGFSNTVVTPYGIFIADGVGYSDWATSDNPDRDEAALFLQTGELVARYRDDGDDVTEYVAEGADWGVAFGAWCVLNGTAITSIPTAHFGTDKSARTIVGQASNGDFIIIMIEGVTGSYGATANECGPIAVSAGCERAFIGDGGGSSQLWWDGFYVLPSSDSTFADERPIHSGLGINCPVETYDSGWVDQPIDTASGFSVRNGVGVRVRQADAAVSIEFDVGGDFTTTPGNILSTSDRPYRYMPGDDVALARGFLSGPGGEPALWYAGTGISVRTVSGTITGGYVAGHATWTAKHAKNNGS